MQLFHSKSVVEFANEQKLILLFTPPYSPWYNPIEFCFSIIKRHWYQHQDIEQAFQALTPGHCQAFFNKSQNCNFQKI